MFNKILITILLLTSFSVGAAESWRNTKGSDGTVYAQSGWYGLSLEVSKQIDEVVIALNTHKNNPIIPIIDDKKGRIGKLILTFKDGTKWPIVGKIENPNFMWSIVYNDVMLNKLACEKQVGVDVLMKSQGERYEAHSVISLAGSTKSLVGIGFSPDCKNKGVTWKVAKSPSYTEKKILKSCHSEISGKARSIRMRRKSLDGRFKDFVDECRFNKKGEIIHTNQNGFKSNVEWTDRGQLKTQHFLKNDTKHFYEYDPYGNLVAKYSKNGASSPFGVKIKAGVRLSVHPHVLGKEDGVAATVGKHNFFSHNNYKQKEIMNVNKEGSYLPIKIVRTDMRDGGYTEQERGSKREFDEVRTYNRHGDKLRSKSKNSSAIHSYSKKDRYGNWTKSFLSMKFDDYPNSKQVTTREISYW